MKTWKITQALILRGEDIFGEYRNIMVFIECTKNEIWKWAESHKEETDSYRTLWTEIIECREQI